MDSVNISGKRTLYDLLMVTGSNLIHLIANIMFGLLLPVILSNADYGFYKTYTLYIGYCGLLHLGFVDGIVLKYAGKEYANIDKRVFCSYTKIFFTIEALFSLITISLGILLFRNEARIIAIFVGINITMYSMTLYYQYISQATSRFKEFTFRKILNSLLTILAVIVMLVMKLKGKWTNIEYWEIIITVQIISAILLAWYVWTYKDITFGQGVAIKSISYDVIEICKKGIILTVAYEFAQLMLQMDRQFVSVLFSIETFGQYAFAYNLLSCVTTMVTAISTVMFPLLKKMKKDQALKMLPKGMTLMSILVCFILSGTTIIELLVNQFLPDYVMSLVYFKIVFPALAMTCCVTIIMFTFYKLMDCIFVYLKCSLITLVVSFVLNVFSYLIWKTPEAIAIASVLSVALWYAAVSSNLEKICYYKWKKDYVYILSMIAVYYMVFNMVVNPIISIIVYLMVFTLVTYVFKRKELRDILGNK